MNKQTNSRTKQKTGRKSGERRRTVLLTVVFILLAAGMLLMYRTFAPSKTEGQKTVTITVDHLKGEDRSFTYRTEETCLEGLLKETGLAQGPEDMYGIFIETVDGETADPSLEQWWGFTVNGEFSQYGAGSLVLNDGDVIGMKLNEGYSEFGE